MKKAIIIDWKSLEHCVLLTIVENNNFVESVVISQFSKTIMEETMALEEKYGLRHVNRIYKF